MIQVYKLSLYIVIVSLFCLYIPAQSQSVLSTGQWYQLGIKKDGIYKLTYQDFVDMGFDVDSINPNHIQLFGNLEGQLPEANNIVVPNKLCENAIYVSGADDGSFDANDYVVFYAKGADSWRYEILLQRFRYESHDYDEINYFYLTIGKEEGSRIESQTSSSQTPLKTIYDFLDYQAFEVETVNLIKSGRKWYGEPFDTNPNQRIDFDFPNFINDKKVMVGLYAAGRSEVHSEIHFNIDGTESKSLTIPKRQGDYIFAKEAEIRTAFYTDKNYISLNLNYSQPEAVDNAWINYLEVNASRKLKMHNHQTAFSFDVMLDNNHVFEFKLSNATNKTTIWEVSKDYQPKLVTGTTLNEDTLSFSMVLDQTHYFVAFDEQGMYTPEFIGEIENQDLKALEPFDIAFITTEEYLGQAQRLADFHLEKDSLSSTIVFCDKIYNEFSSGKQDPTAIRNFIRYHYDKNSDEDKPQYIILFGDASYDYKQILPKNTNIVPVYQSKGSTSLTDTYNTDDYFGIMGQTDGENALGKINISVGRFPVHTIEDAKIMVDKTIAYASNTKERMGSWKNNVCFIADDEDNNKHFNHSNALSDTFLIQHPEYNVDKIMLDSYVQESTANGKRYPDVTDAINQRVEDGVLFFNYTGHGGHLALTDERILKISDIVNWKNKEKLGIWIVASCEFGPFDNPDHTSAGEHMVLNPNGGGVAIFTTTRLAYAESNFNLNQKFHEIAFSSNENGDHHRLGDIIRYAKNECDNIPKNLNFVLLGDPVLKMAYPEFHIKTTHINKKEVSTSYNDTIKARQTIELKGRLTDLTNETLEEFNGLVYTKVFGKASSYSTLANDPDSYQAEFQIYDQLIYEGETRANKGLFECEFIIPDNIVPSFGNGKISYYAIDDTLNNGSYCDANGGFIDFIIGGMDESIENDLRGPDISIHLDNYNFEDGMSTSTSPLLLVDLYDDNGINSINFGFGKEIKATLDQLDQYYLNDFYQPIEFSYKKGKIEFDLETLAYGNHSLTIKAWDMFDNASEKSVDFMVTTAEKIDIYDLVNQPNPVYNETSFVFSHNQTEESELLVDLKLYDINGKLLWSYENSATVLGNSIEPIYFNTSNFDFSQIKSGIYTYTLKVENNDGQNVKDQQKMLIVK